jgi:hypothetical protein
MSKHWWNVNRQSKIYEYDTTPKKEWIHMPTFGDYFRIGISLCGYWGMLTVIPDMNLWYRMPIAMLTYLVIYIALILGGVIYTSLKNKNVITNDN